MICFFFRKVSRECKLSIIVKMIESNKVMKLGTLGNYSAHPDKPLIVIQASPQKKPRCSYHKDKFRRDEDELLKKLVTKYGNDWNLISNHMQGRNPRQCRERWKNYVNPELLNIPWTDEEDNLLSKKLAEIGTKWHVVAKFFPNRGINNVKNRWLTINRRKNKLALNDAIAKEDHSTLQIFRDPTKAQNETQINSNFHSTHEKFPSISAITQSLVSIPQTTPIPNLLVPVTQVMSLNCQKVPETNRIEHNFHILQQSKTMIMPYYQPSKS